MTGLEIKPDPHSKSRLSHMWVIVCIIRISGAGKHVSHPIDAGCLASEFKGNFLFFLPSHSQRLPHVGPFLNSASSRHHLHIHLPIPLLSLEAKIVS